MRRGLTCPTVLDRAAPGPVPTDGPGLGIRVERDRSGVPALIEFHGELDLATSPDFRAAVSSVIDDGCRRVAVDMREVNFCDATGLKSLSSAEAALRRDGGLLTVQGPCPSLQTLLDLLDGESGIEVVPPSAT